MSFRRRHRWFRRLALGLAVVVAAAAGSVSQAYAKADLGGPHAVYETTPGWLHAQGPAVVGEPAASKALAGFPAGIAAEPVRPDDEGARFAHSAVASQPEASTTSWTFERGDALVVGLATLAVALGLSLALGVSSRRRIAGL